MNRISEIREQAGISQAALHRKLGGAPIPPCQLRERATNPRPQ